MKQLKSLIVIILLLAVLIVSSFALASWWNPFSWNVWKTFQNPQPTPTPTPTTNPVDNSKNNWKTYNNAQFGYQIKYLNDWSNVGKNTQVGITDFLSPLGVQGFAKLYGDYTCYLTINPVQTAYLDNFDAYLVKQLVLGTPDYINSEIKQFSTGTPPKDLPTIQDTAINGMPAKEVVVSNITHRYWIKQVNGRDFSFNIYEFMFPMKTGGVLKPTDCFSDMDKMLATFKITNTFNPSPIPPPPSSPTPQKLSNDEKNNLIKNSLSVFFADAEGAYYRSGTQSYANLSCMNQNIQQVCDNIKTLAGVEPTIHSSKDSFCVYVQLLLSQSGQTTYSCTSSKGTSQITTTDPSGYCNGQTFNCP